MGWGDGRPGAEHRRGDRLGGRRGRFPWDHWVFDPVPERKRVKNRVHWDVDLTGPDATALIAAGSTLLAEPTEATRWWVLADPEGNEFCAFPPRAAE